MRASSDRTHQPSRQILEERLWVDPGKHQSSSLDRFDGRHWEILSGRHRLSSPERHWRHRAQSSQTLAGFSLGRYWQTQLRTSSDRTHQPIRQIPEERLWVDPGRHQVAPVRQIWQQTLGDTSGRHRLSSLEKTLADTELSPDRH